jgi:tetratricopeptide (TPR) repeat protein
MTAARCLNNLERYNEALEYLDKVDISEMNFVHLKLFLNIIRDLTIKTKDFVHTAKIYGKILELEDDDKTGLILFLLEQYYMEYPKYRKDFVQAMVNSGVNGKYIDLMKIVKADSDKKDVSCDLQKFISGTDRWNDGYSEAIYLAMKHNVDLSGTITKLNTKLMKEILQRISEGHKDYAQITLDYCTSVDFTGSIRELQWIVTAMENAVYTSNELDDENKPVLYDAFVSTLSDYVMNIYNPELFNVDDIEVLPELHRFGYYMTLAFMARNEGNDIVYIRCMKDALKLCESMKELVSFYLSEFEKSLK